MKLKDTITDLLVEEVSKKVLVAITKQWFGDEPTEEQREIATKYATEFFKRKTQLGQMKPEHPLIRIFTNRFDGEAGFEKYEGTLTDIFSYTLKQMKFILSGLGAVEDEEDLGNPNPHIPNIIQVSNPKKITNEMVEESKKLWYSKTPDLIIDDDGLRVYSINSQQKAISYGFYQNEAQNIQNQSRYQWCVTQSAISRNYWTNYRDTHELTFYFVIDESKNPEADKHFLGALQVDPTSTSGYRLTSILNDGDNPITKDNLIRIYPKLSGHFDKLEAIPYDAGKELIDKENKINLINENPGHQYEFKRQTPAVMSSYIVDNRRPLSRRESWQVLSKELKRSYMILTETNTVIERFGPEIYDEITKTPKDFKMLDSLLKTRVGIERGALHIGDHIMSTEYEIAKTSDKDDNVVLYVSRTTGKYGFYDLSKSQWVNSGGKTYNCEYGRIGTNMRVDLNGETWIYESYGKGGEEEFYVLFSMTTLSTNKNLPSLFYSKSRWDEMLKDNDSEPNIDDADLNEDDLEYYKTDDSSPEQDDFKLSKLV